MFNTSFTIQLAWQWIVFTVRQTTINTNKCCQRACLFAFAERNPFYVADTIQCCLVPIFNTIYIHCADLSTCKKTHSCSTVTHIVGRDSFSLTLFVFSLSFSLCVCRPIIRLTFIESYVRKTPKLRFSSLHCENDTLICKPFCSTLYMPSLLWNQRKHDIMGTPWSHTSHMSYMCWNIAA